MGGAQWANVANHGSDHTTETNTHNTGTQPTLRHSTQQTNVNRVTHKASQPWSGQLDTTPWVLERTWDESLGRCVCLEGRYDVRFLEGIVHCLWARALA